MRRSVTRSLSSYMDERDREFEYSPLKTFRHKALPFLPRQLSLGEQALKEHLGPRPMRTSSIYGQGEVTLKAIPMKPSGFKPANWAIKKQAMEKRLRKLKEEGI